MGDLVFFRQLSVFGISLKMCEPRIFESAFVPLKTGGAKLSGTVRDVAGLIVDKVSEGIPTYAYFLSSVSSVTDSERSLFKLRSSRRCDLDAA